MSFMLITAVLAMTEFAVPKPEPVEIFGDWVVGCDNERFCRAVGLAQQDDAPPLPVTIWREAGPTATPVIELDLWGLPNAPLLVDGKRLPPKEREDEIVKYQGRDAFRLIGKLAEARNVTIGDLDKARYDAGANHSYGVASLTGLKAALLYIDEQQARLDTPTAFVRKGKRPMPDVMAGHHVYLNRAVPTKKPAILRSRGSISDDQISVRLDENTNLLVIHPPGDNGAYNFASRVLIVSEYGAVRAAKFDIAPAMDWDEEDNVRVNVTWEADKAMLATFALGDSFGTCGIKRLFAWGSEDQIFRLVEQEENGECMRTSTFIRTWTVRFNGE